MNESPPTVPASRRCGLAVAALVCGIFAILLPCVGLPFAIAALICGIMAFTKIKAGGGLITGRGMATAGLIMAALSVIILPVVIILAGMLLPAVATARAKAREAVCRNNVMQIHRMTMMYADEHDGKLPGDLDQLVPYLKDPTRNPHGVPRLFLCPSADIQSWASYELVDEWERLSDIENLREAVLLLEVGNPHRQCGHVVYADGRVELFRPPTDDVEMDVEDDSDE